MMMKAAPAISRVSGRVGPNSLAPVAGNRRGFVAQRQVMAPLRSASQTATTVESVTELMSMNDFDSVMESAGDKLVVLDIGSTKCGPCKMVWPKYVEMSEEFGEQAVFLKINGDTNKDTVVRTDSCDSCPGSVP